MDDSLKDMVDTAKNGEKVDVDISVNVPGDGAAYTKALGENPTINSLYLAVFDEAGYLVEYVKATEKAVDFNGQANQKAYTVKLTLSNAKRIIHFIANNKETPKYGTEAESIGSLTTSDQWDVYWQRTVLENGIQLQADGETITEETKEALNNIGLIRNFAKLTMSSEAPNFEPISFYVVNERTIGSVAPYNTSTGSFIDNYIGYRSLLELQNIGYDGYIPKGSPLNTSIPQTEAEFDIVATAFGAASDNYANYHYLYERETPLDFKTQPYIIVKGMYGGEGPYFYKVSFSSYEGKLFPFLRNFNYGITIKTVNRKGSDTPLLASASTGSGDISTSIDPTIINISDGSHRLFVSYTDTLLVSNNEIQLRYKYIPDLGTGDTANDILTNPDTDQNSGVFFSVVTDQNTTVSSSTMVGPVIKSYSVAGNDGNDGYRTVTLQINNTQDIDLKEYILVSGQRMSSGARDILSRKVTYTLRKKQPLKVVCVPDEIESVKGTPVDVKVGIPAGLGESQFPMNINVEALNLTLSPEKGNLPVQTGKSTAISGDTVGKPAFWFVRTVTWDEYNTKEAVDEYKYVDCYFISNTASSATTIVASNKYFDQGSGAFTNYKSNEFTNLKIDGSFKAFAEKPVTFQFDLPALPQNSNGNLDDTYVYIALDGAESADPNLTQVGTVTIDGKKLAQYRYKPTSIGTQSLNLMTTDDNTGAVSAYLSAYHYNDANITAKAKIYFYFGDNIYAQGDPWYSGARNGGLKVNSKTNYTWYVHFDDLKSYTGLTSNPSNTYQSSIVINGNTYQGTLSYERTGYYNARYQFTDYITVNGDVYVKFTYNDTQTTWNTSGKYDIGFTATDGTNRGSDSNVLTVRPVEYDIYFPVTWSTSTDDNVYIGVKTAFYVDVYDESGTYNIDVVPFINGGRQSNMQKTSTTSTKNGKTYTRYQITFDNGLWLEEGEHPLSVQLINGEKVLASTSKDVNFKIGMPFIKWDTDMYDHTTNTLKAYIYCEGLSYEQYPQDATFIVGNSWYNNQAKKTNESKDINGKTYYAYTMALASKPAAGTQTVRGIVYYPNSGRNAEDSKELKFKTERAISASDISVKVKETGTITVSGNDGTGRNLSFYSSERDVISLDGANYTANKKGNATITVTAEGNDQYYGATATINATVSLKTKAISASNITMRNARVNSTGTITVNGNDGTDRKLDATSSSPNNAEVSVNGNIVTVTCKNRPGNNSPTTVRITITAKDNDEYEASTITVDVTMYRN